MATYHLYVLQIQCIGIMHWLCYKIHCNYNIIDQLQLASYVTRCYIHRCIYSHIRTVKATLQNFNSNISILFLNYLIFIISQLYFYKQLASSFLQYSILYVRYSVLSIKHSNPFCSALCYFTFNCISYSQLQQYSQLYFLCLFGPYMCMISYLVCLFYSQLFGCTHIQLCVRKLLAHTRTHRFVTFV